MSGVSRSRSARACGVEVAPCGSRSCSDCRSRATGVGPRWPDGAGCRVGAVTAHRRAWLGVRSMSYIGLRVLDTRKPPELMRVSTTHAPDGHTSTSANGPLAVPSDLRPGGPACQGWITRRPWVMTRIPQATSRARGGWRPGVMERLDGTGHLACQGRIPEDVARGDNRVGRSVRRRADPRRRPLTLRPNLRSPNPWRQQRTQPRSPAASRLTYRRSLSAPVGRSPPRWGRVRPGGAKPAPAGHSPRIGGFTRRARISGGRLGLSPPWGRACRR